MVGGRGGGGELGGYHERFKKMQVKKSDILNRVLSSSPMINCKHGFSCFQIYRHYYYYMFLVTMQRACK